MRTTSWVAAVALPMLLGSALVSEAATVDSVTCNAGAKCATAVHDFQFGDATYEVSFFFGNFYDRFPDPTQYPFWGSDASAAAVATELAKVFFDNEIEMFYIDGRISNGLFVPFAYYNEDVLWVRVIGFWDDYAEQPVVLPDPLTGAITAPHLVFEKVAPDLSMLLQQLADEVVGVGSGKKLVRSVESAQTYYAVPDIQATCAVLNDFVSQVGSWSTGKRPKIEGELASTLIADAQTIMDAIDCD